MFSTGFIVYMYVLAFLILTLPLVAVFVLKRKYDFPLIKFLIIGAGGYILILSFIIPFIYSLVKSVFSMFGVSETLWTTSNPPNIFVSAIVTALLQTPLFYLVFKYILKSNLHIYDAIAAGVTYSYIPCMTCALTLTNYARIANASNKGTLDTLVNDSVSLEAMNDLLTDLAANSPLLLFVNTFHVVFTMFAIIVLMMLAYHGLKTKKFRFVWIASGINLSYLLCTTFINYFFVPSDSAITTANLIPSLLMLVALTGAMIYFIIVYFRWYRKQQYQLLQEKTAYAEYMKKNQK